jgi:hypothetical protein
MNAKLAFFLGDYKTAAAELPALAKQGDVVAQYDLGLMYDSGLGVLKDSDESVRWIRSAAERRYAPAEFSYGLMFDDGDGVAQSYREALKWYMRAASKGNVEAQNNLGVLYIKGHGVEVDMVLAHMWFNLAAIHGDSVAVKNRDQLAADMSRGQLEHAQQLAHDCMASNFKNCGDSGVAPREESSPSIIRVPIKGDSSIYTIAVTINEKLPLDFVLDSGASDVSVPADVVLTLVRMGTLTKDDFIGKQTYELADGSTAPSDVFRIRSLKIGDFTLENVVASVGDVHGHPLLGQSFLNRFRSWSIDNGEHALVLTRSDTPQPDQVSGASVAAEKQVAPQVASQSTNEGMSQTSESVHPSFDCAKGAFVCGKCNLQGPQVGSSDNEYASGWTAVVLRSGGRRLNTSQFGSGAVIH